MGEAKQWVGGEGKLSPTLLSSSCAPACSVWGLEMDKGGVVSGGGYAPSQRRISLGESCSFFPKQLSSSSLGTALAWAAQRGMWCFPTLFYCAGTPQPTYF